MKKIEIDLLETTKETYEGMSIDRRFAGGLTAYVTHKYPVGNFLRAIITNNLEQAMGYNGYEGKTIPAYIHWLKNNAPSECWGSEEAYENWVPAEKEGIILNKSDLNIVIYDECEEVLRVHTEAKQPARCITERKFSRFVSGIPVYKIIFKEVIDLPAVKENVFYIVSSIVAEAMRGKRTDLLIPEGIFGDETGKFVNCRGLNRV